MVETNFGCGGLRGNTSEFGFGDGRGRFDAESLDGLQLLCHLLVRLLVQSASF